MGRTALISVRDAGNEKVISFSRRHINTDSTARQIAGRLGELLEGGEERDFETLNLDLEQIDWLSSVALNHLIGINRSARDRGIRLVLTNVQESVREVFALTRLERMFELMSAEQASA